MGLENVKEAHSCLHNHVNAFLLWYPLKYGSQGYTEIMVLNLLMYLDEIMRRNIHLFSEFQFLKIK